MLSILKGETKCCVDSEKTAEVKWHQAAQHCQGPVAANTLGRAVLTGDRCCRA